MIGRVGLFSPEQATQPRLAAKKRRPGLHISWVRLQAGTTPIPISLWRQTRERAAMNKADLYRAKADEYRRMAAKVSTPRDQREWLQLASAWLQLIPESPPISADCFDSMERVWGTGQQKSSAEH
jgi:hypothetical protein